MRGATEKDFEECHQYGVSIHAPHARGDVSFMDNTDRILDVSIHAPHARGDKDRLDLAISEMVSIHAPHARGDCKILFL